jgi:hypothetical protein
VHCAEPGVSSPVLFQSGVTARDHLSGGNPLDLERAGTALAPFNGGKSRHRNNFDSKRGYKRPARRVTAATALDPKPKFISLTSRFKNGPTKPTFSKSGYALN